MLIGRSLPGRFLTFLGLRTGNLGLVAGIHLGWNIAQKALCGPQDGAPSLRPLQLHGPEAWVDRPGHPDPVWLQIVWTLGLAVIAGVDLWRPRSR